MNKGLITIVLLMIISVGSEAQNLDKWDQYGFLIGEWKGEGSGTPGQGEGIFSFKYDLDNNILKRESHSEYPATQDKPLIIHDDLMIIYPDNYGKPDKAIYFDNEGHVINYAITFPNNSNLVFTSEKTAHGPVFRLTYSKIDDTTLNVKFEMSRDGVNFFTYIEGKSKRTK